MIPFSKKYIITSYFEALLDLNEETVELLPFGHSRHFPLKFNFNDRKISSGELNFFNEVFHKNFDQTNFISTESCSVELHPEKNKLIILNCLDNCFGHALLKLLYMADRTEKNKEDYDFLWIVPAALKHFLVHQPGVNFLIIQQSFPALEKCLVLNKEIEKISSNYKEVYLEPAETYASFDISLLTKHLRFFKKADPVAIKDKIIFYYRADYFRMWNGKKQGKRVTKLFSIMKSYFDSSIQFCIVGDKDKFRFPEWIQDRRIVGFSEENDFAYNQLFSSALICIGFNGSHMLFPSMFTECTVHLHPSHKYKNMAEDTVANLYANEMLAAYKHLYYFGNHNCSDVQPERLAILILFHYEGLIEKKYKLFERSDISQEAWIQKNYPFFELKRVNTYRKMFNAKEAMKNRMRYYIDKWI